MAEILGEGLWSSDWLSWSPACPPLVPKSPAFPAQLGGRVVSVSCLLMAAAISPSGPHLKKDRGTQRSHIVLLAHKPSPNTHRPFGEGREGWPQPDCGVAGPLRLQSSCSWVSPTWSLFVSLPGPNLSLSMLPITHCFLSTRCLFSTSDL